MTKIIGLENIGELYDMWTRGAVATYEYEGMEKFGTKERSFTRQSDNEDKELAEELKGKNIPIAYDWKWNSWSHPNFSVMVEIDGTPAEVCFEFGSDGGGEVTITKEGKISGRYGPNSRTPHFAYFQGFVGSQAVNLTIKGMLKAHQVRRIYDHIRSELKDLADWFSFSNINENSDSQFSAFCDQEKGWELSENFSQDWSYESEMWVGRFWSFEGFQNRPLTPEETALMEVHKAMRETYGLFTLDEIHTAERGGFESKAIIDSKAEEYRRAKIEREMIAMRPDNILRAAIKERDEEIARKKRAEEARAAAERRAAEEAERAKQAAERARQEVKDKIEVFLAGIGHFVMPRGKDGVSTPISDMWEWEHCGHNIVLFGHGPNFDHIWVLIEFGFEESVKKIVRWAVENGAREPELKTEAA